MKVADILTQARMITLDCDQGITFHDRERQPDYETMFKREHCVLLHFFAS